MGNRNSPLVGHYQSGKSGVLKDGETAGVALREVRGLTLYQIAVWANSIDAVGVHIASTVGCKNPPSACQAVSTGDISVLRIEPLKWWLYGVEPPDVDAEQGAILDLSHSRTHIRFSGPDATALLNRHLPLDLREQSFALGAVASTMIHHVGVTLWRSNDGYELFIPRSFALFLWEGFVDSASQFGLEII